MSIPDDNIKKNKLDLKYNAVLGLVIKILGAGVTVFTSSIGAGIALQRTSPKDLVSLDLGANLTLY